MIKLKKYTGLLYILPWLIGFLALQLYPLLASLYYSLTKYSILDPPRFIGFANYIKIFTRDEIFWKSLWITFKYAFLAVPVKIAFALFIAVLLNTKLKGINMYRTIFYMPSILGGSVVLSILWRFMFNSNGLINNIIGMAGIKPVDWLGDPRIALYTISILPVWQFGSSMVLFLAGLKQVPGELYEAGNIDGASRFRMFLSITLPMLSPIIFFNLIMQMINNFQQFTAAFVVTKGGPVKSTYLYAIMLYDNAFNYARMGYASALSWILFIILIAMTALIFKSSASWTFYENKMEFK